MISRKILLFPIKNSVPIHGMGIVKAQTSLYTSITRERICRSAGLVGVKSPIEISSGGEAT
jgi:hypothetical protein